MARIIRHPPTRGGVSISGGRDKQRQDRHKPQTHEVNPSLGRRDMGSVLMGCVGGSGKFAKLNLRRTRNGGCVLDESIAALQQSWRRQPEGANASLSGEEAGRSLEMLDGRTSWIGIRNYRHARYPGRMRPMLPQPRQLSRHARARVRPHELMKALGAQPGACERDRPRVEAARGPQHPSRPELSGRAGNARPVIIPHRPPGLRQAALA